MNDARPRPRRTWACSLVAALAAALVLAFASPAAAHATLVDTDPDEGAVLDAAPDVVRFTFSEPVRSVSDGVRVFDATGADVASSARTRDDELLVTLDEEVGDGTLVVAWRVVSVDGHPIAGTLTFAIGAPSPEVHVPALGGSAGEVPVALSLARWPGYAGLLLAVGLVWFAALVLPAGLKRVERARLRIRETARVAAAVSVTGWLACLPLTALYVRGTGTVLDAATWRALPTDEVVLTGATVVALAIAVAVLPVWPADYTRPVLAAVAGGLALAPLPLSGHTRAVAHTETVVVVDALHLVAGAVWLGGLVGLAFAVPALAGRHGATAMLVNRFSTVAASSLAALVLSGAFLAWRLVGSWSELFASDYGRVLLVKIAVVGAAVGVAAYNRYRLVPRLRGDWGYQAESANARTLARTARTEAAALVGVLLVTGFLVQNNPPSGPAADLAPVGAQTARIALGDLRASITLDPAVAGMNTVTLEIRDQDGLLAEGTAPPRMRISSDNLGGDIPLERVRRGRYQGRVVIPRDGVWVVQVSLRLSRFANPIGRVEFHLGAHDEG